jgi:asparaginyl-tRNA synthetase
MAAVARMRSELTFATHSFFRENRFLCVHTPVVTTNDCEGAGEMFQVTTLFSQAQKADKDLLKLKLSKMSNIEDDVDGSVGFASDFFRRQAYLTVSGQLQAEAYACALSRVYTFGPTFRAENSHTSRHLAEFWMVEPEMVFANLQVSSPLYIMYTRFICALLLY